jgi:dihydroorotate dehydrogenase electron transfer subunit
MLQLTAELIGRHMAGAGQELVLQAPDLARQIRPGQPILVRWGRGMDSYLRRVLYPTAIDVDTVTLRVPPGGDWGHAWLQAAPLGTRLDCLGPVGVGYRLPPGSRNLLCVGEGEPAWTLLPAVLQASSAGGTAEPGQARAVTLAVQAISSGAAIPVGRLPATVEYRLAAAGANPASRGRLAPWLPALIAWADTVLAAGSLSFYEQLAAVVREARFGLSRGFVQVLYPATILCGVGACLACTADLASGRRRICLRGPVLDLFDVQP